MKQPMIRTNFYYPKQMLARLKQVSLSEGLPVSELIRRGIELLLKEKGV